MIRIVLFLLTISVFAACGPREERSADEGVVGPIEERVAVHWLVFGGEIPCIDCDKIEVELWLEKDSVKETSDYRIVTIHRNTAQGDIKEELTGIYAKLAGYRGDPTATVYQLNPGGNNPRYFWLKEDGNLRVLGQDREKLVEDDPEEEYDYDLQLLSEDEVTYDDRN